MPHNQYKSLLWIFFEYIMWSVDYFMWLKCIDLITEEATAWDVSCLILLGFVVFPAIETALILLWDSPESTQSIVHSLPLI